MYVSDEERKYREELERARYRNAKNIYFAYRDLGKDPKKSNIAPDLLEVLEKEYLASKTRRESLSSKEGTLPIHEDTEQMIDELVQRLKKYSMKKSIGVFPIFPFIKKKKMSKKEFAKRVILFSVIGGVTLSSASYAIVGLDKMSKRKEFIEEYKNTIFEPHTDKRIVDGKESFYHEETGEYYAYAVKKEVHDHDISEILLKTKEHYSDPIVAFYVFYFSLDAWCKENCLEDYLAEFNKVFGTGYTSYEDFMMKNGFLNDGELKSYINKVMEGIELGDRIRDSQVR